MSSIRIGVCGWGEHDLYPKGIQAKDKLSIYASYFPVVELDSSFYSIPAMDRMIRWSHETPGSFQFVVKAYRELTGHGRLEKAPERAWIDLVDDTKRSLEPLIQDNKLAALLFQFPPWFDCQRKHVQYLRRIRKAFFSYPVAIEFRNRSWYTVDHIDKMIQLLKEEQLVHTVCDEPQIGEKSVPIVPIVTNPEIALVRFHGRNVAGWNQSQRPDWRKIRYAYRYSEQEIREWIPLVERMNRQAKKVILLFNNNSEGHAVESAQRMMTQLGIEYGGLHMRQGKIL